MRQINLSIISKLLLTKLPVHGNIQEVKFCGSNFIIYLIYFALNYYIGEKFRYHDVKLYSK